jgi:hypothetical protein
MMMMMTCNTRIKEGDAMALTALTALTCLVVQNVGVGVVDDAASALASSLTQLCHLDLDTCGLTTMACLANIGGLQQLTQLRLLGNSAVAEHGLMLLTRLTGLQQLGICIDKELTYDVAQKFVSLMQCQ